MRPPWRSRTGVGTMWTLVLLVGLLEARYLVKDPPWLLHVQAMMLMRHPIWVHIAGGIVALLTGLFQFLTMLRTERPRIHRLLGKIYVASILIGGIAGLRLSPDTPLFIVQGLMEGRALDFSFVGLSPTLLGYGPTSCSPSQFFLTMLGFVALAMTWLATTGMAFIRIRQGRVSDHRAWMTRSYALTFAAITVRLVSLPLEIVTRNPVVAITCTFWSWVLNLVVAEWLLWRERIASVRIATQPHRTLKADGAAYSRFEFSPLPNGGCRTGRAGDDAEFMEIPKLGSSEGPENKERGRCGVPTRTLRKHEECGTHI